MDLQLFLLSCCQWIRLTRSLFSVPALGSDGPGRVSGKPSYQVLALGLLGLAEICSISPIALSPRDSKRKHILESRLGWEVWGNQHPLECASIRVLNQTRYTALTCISPNRGIHFLLFEITEFPSILVFHCSSSITVSMIKRYASSTAAKHSSLKNSSPP